MARKSIKGLFVAVELDLTKLKQGVSTAVNTLTTEFEKAKDSIDKSLKLDSGAFNEVLSDVAKSINRVQNAIQTKSGGEVFSKFIKDNDEFKKSLESVATQAGVSSEIIRDSLSKAVKANQIKETVSAVRALGYSLNLSGEQLLQYAKNLGVTGEALEKLATHTDRLNAKSGGFLTSIKNLMTGGNAMAAIQSSLATLGANISTAGIVELGKAAVDTTIKVDSLRTAYASIYGDSSKAAAQLDFVRSVTERLGLDFYATAEAAKSFFAAAESSDIKDEANKIFMAFSSSTAALRMTQEQANGVYLAISQMVSKGKISAEELRQQLAERLPGAVGLLAQAIGVSSAQLDKMLEQGQVDLEKLAKMATGVAEKYGDAGLAASNSLLGELNRLKTSWTDFKANLFSSQGITDLFVLLREKVDWLRDNVETLTKSIKSLTVAFGMFFATKAVAQIGNISLAVTNAIADFRAWIKSIRAAETAMKSLALASTGVGAIIGVLSGALAFVWMSFKDDTDKATMSLDDLRESMKRGSAGVKNFSEEMALADKKVRGFYEAQLKLEELNLTKKLKEDANSFSNFAKLIDEEVANIGKSYGVGVDPLMTLTSVAGVSQTAAALMELRVELDKLSKQRNEGKLSEIEYGEAIKSAYTKIVESYKGLSSSLEPFGLQIDVINGKLLITNNALTDTKGKIKDIKNISETPITVDINVVSNADKALDKLKLDNIKKSVKLYKDAVAKEATDIFIEITQSGDLLDAAGKSWKMPVDKLAESIKNAGGTVAGLRSELSKLVTDDSGKLLKAFDEAIKLIEQQTSANEKNSRSFKKYADFKHEVEGLNERLADMAKIGELGGDTVAYGIYKIEARAEKAKVKLRETLEQLERLGKISPAELAIFELKSEKAIDTEEYQSEKQYLKSHMDEIKGYYNELREFKGEIASSEIEKIKDEYAIKEEALKSSLNNELEYFKNNEEKKAEIEAQYKEYSKALEAKKNEDILRASDNMIGGLKLGLKDYLDSGKSVAGQLADVTLKGFQGMGDALANFVVAADKSWDSIADAFSDLARSMINDISKIIAHATVMNGMKAMFGGTSFGSFLGFADGGVVNTGLSSYSNGVYNTPTFFTTNGGGFQRYANGGVFGEAGPEAIMPLTRMPNGRLGVAATGGGGGGDVQVNVYNNSNSKAEVRQSTSSNGGKTIDVLIGDVVAKQMSTPGSKLNRTVTTYTGGQQAVTRR